VQLLAAALEHSNLVTQGKVFGLQGSAAPQTRSESHKKSEKQGIHDMPSLISARE
jgi:hypothetical protein